MTAGRTRTIPTTCAACVALCGLALAGAARAAEITQADLLHRLIDLDRLMSPPSGERTGWVSIAEGRAAKLPKEGEWSILADLRGPGAITRIWTSRALGDLRIVVDGQAAFDAPFAELFSGSQAPFGPPLCAALFDGGACRSYFPIGYAQSCRVLLRGGEPALQLSYTTFPEGALVASFKRPLDTAAVATLKTVSDIFDQGPASAPRRTRESGRADEGEGPGAFSGGPSEAILPPDKRGAPEGGEASLKPGEKFAWPVAGQGVIRALYIALSDRRNPRAVYALHQCVLRIYFDGDSQPSVEAPLCAFFGAGFDLTPYLAVPVGADLLPPIPLPDRLPGQDRCMYSFFPMPFERGAVVEVENMGEDRRPIGFFLFLRVDAGAPPGGALRFHAAFRRENPCKGGEYLALRAAGAGRVVGLALNVDSPRAGWWGGGVERFDLNGSREAPLTGTGLGEFFGDGPTFRAHDGGLHGVTRAAEYGKRSAYRWFTGDCVNFERGAEVILENTQTDPADVYWESVAYWYGEAPARGPFKRLTREELRPPGLRIPGAVEVEGHVQGDGWGSLQMQNDAFTEYSNDLAALITTDQPIKVLLPCTTAGRYRLQLRTNPRRSFDRIEVSDAGGKQLADLRFDAKRAGLYDVGEVELKAGDNLLLLRCTRPIALDCWIVSPLNAK